MGVRGIALGLVAVGLGFAFFAIDFMGVDLLIDAVGFLIAYNGLRVLKKLCPGFAGSDILCIGLVALAALQLFLGGTALWVAGILRPLAECALFALMLRGFAQLLPRGRRPALRWAVLCALLLNMAAEILGAAAGILQWALPPWWWMAGYIFVRGLLLAALLVAALLPEDTTAG